MMIVLLLLAQTGLAIAQTKIQFRPVSFTEARDLATDEGKLIFFDAYTSWCAPCKWMETNVFIQPEVADYFNAHFINVKFDCEAGEGIDLAKHYQIRSFPTYLFLDGNGELIYRTQSRMEASAFLEHAQRAGSPEFQIPTLRSRFQSGDRDAGFLLRFIQVMDPVDQKLTEEARKELAQVADDVFLRSPEGWEVIRMMAHSDQDRYGRFFQANKAYFASVADPADFHEKETQLLRYAMYGYIRQADKEQFDAGLVHFSGSAKHEMQVEAAMFRADWAGTHGTPREFKRVTNELRKGVLKNEDEKLSFIARRFGKPRANGLQWDNLAQCYVLAKQAVRLNPHSYSNQGTFADICIAFGKKKEAIKAAEAARALAELETTKIQGLADTLVERAKAME